MSVMQSVPRKCLITFINQSSILCCFLTQACVLAGQSFMHAFDVCLQQQGSRGAVQTHVNGDHERLTCLHTCSCCAKKQHKSRNPAFRRANRHQRIWCPDAHHLGIHISDPERDWRRSASCRVESKHCCCALMTGPATSSRARNWVDQSVV